MQIVVNYSKLQILNLYLEFLNSMNLKDGYSGRSLLLFGNIEKILLLSLFFIFFFYKFKFKMTLLNGNLQKKKNKKKNNSFLKHKFKIKYK